MNKMMKTLVSNSTSMSRKAAYENAKVQWDQFRFERDEKRLQTDLSNRMDKLLVKLDEFITEHEVNLSPSVLSSLESSKAVDRSTVDSLNESAKTIFKVMQVAVTELNTPKKETAPEDTKVVPSGTNEIILNGEKNE